MQQNKLGKMLTGQVWEQMQIVAKNRAWRQIERKIRHRVWDQVGGRVWWQVKEQVWTQAGDQVERQTRNLMLHRYAALDLRIELGKYTLTTIRF
jgi:hypothetical protein